MKIPIFYIFIGFCCLFSSCQSPSSSQQKTLPTTGTAPKNAPTSALPHALIYKTRANYDDKVPVVLSDDGTQIVQYPAPSDVFFRGKLALPTTLAGGYLLDNRGITAKVAFLKWTYAEYSRLPEAPTLSEMEKQIIDRSPLVELWDCDSRSNLLPEEVSALNLLINNGLKDCKRIK